MTLPTAAFADAVVKDVVVIGRFLVPVFLKFKPSPSVVGGFVDARSRHGEEVPLIAVDCRRVGT
jgi:hypothetical protein